MRGCGHCGHRGLCRGHTWLIVCCLLFSAGGWVKFEASLQQHLYFGFLCRFKIANNQFVSSPFVSKQIPSISTTPTTSELLSRGSSSDCDCFLLPTFQSRLDALTWSICNTDFLIDLILKSCSKSASVSASANDEGKQRLTRIVDTDTDNYLWHKPREAHFDNAGVDPTSSTMIGLGVVPGSPSVSASVGGLSVGSDTIRGTAAENIHRDFHNSTITYMCRVVVRWAGTLGWYSFAAFRLMYILPCRQWLIAMRRLTQISFFRPRILKLSPSLILQSVENAHAVLTAKDGSFLNVLLDNLNDANK